MPLEALFGDCSQLLVQHFMLGPGWERGCPSCTYMADHTDGMRPYLAARDVSLVAVSRAPWVEIEAYRARWSAVPKVVYMQNHGVIAIGASPIECINITTMVIKAARIRHMALQAGGTATLPEATIAYLLGRPDEKYRQQVLTER